MRTFLCVTRGNSPAGCYRSDGNATIGEADLVVLFHLDGHWSVWRDRLHGAVATRVPWDDLPAHVKRAVPLHPERP